MQDMNKVPEVDLFSDGGAEPNPGKGGFGVILSYKGRKKEIYQGYNMTTNNRMELMGIIVGLKHLKRKSKVNVYTDSKYIVNAINLGWVQKWKSNNWFRKLNKRAENVDLWEELLCLIEEQECVEFNWIKGHNGHLENERCDQLANLGIHSQNLIDDEGYILSQNPDYQNQVLSEFKVEKEGDECRKCNTKVIKKRPKKLKLKKNEEYYFDWFLLCPKCKVVYYTEEAKRKIDKGNTLF